MTTPLVRLTLAKSLRTVLSATTSSAAYANGVALYLVQLTDARGFALASQIHAKIGGPDPADLRARPRVNHVSTPVVVGAAPVVPLARLVEAQPNDGPRSAQALRSLAAGGAVPVLFVEADGLMVTTLEALEDFEQEDPTHARSTAAPLDGWFRPERMEA